MPPILVLTLHQPWATLFALDIKHHETRSWKTNYKGDLVIHAGKFVDIEACKEFREILIPAGYAKKSDIPVGAALCVVELTGCIPTTDMALLRSIDPLDKRAGNFAPGRYAWATKNLRVFKQPFPISGKQGLWAWPGKLPELAVPA